MSMQIAYAMNPPVGREGQLWGSDHKSRPFILPQRAQTTTMTLADGGPAAGETWTIVATEVDSGQTFALSWTSDTTVALTLAAMTAAASIGKFRDLFTATDDAASVGTWVAKNKGVTYSFVGSVSTGGGTITPAVTVTAIDYTAAGLPFGRAVVRGTNPGEMAEISATSTARDIIGVLFLTDGNAFHSFDSDSLTAEDLCDRGSYQRVLHEGRFLALVEEAVTPASRVYVRRALTGGAGALGRFRDTAAGSTQVLTLTAVADHQLYSVRVDMLIEGERRTLSFNYAPSDGTSTTDLAIDGLEPAAAAAITAQGFTGLVTASAASAAATMTLTAAAGTEFLVPDGPTFGEDTAAEAVTFSLAAADVDTIDCSEIFEYETAAGAGELAVVLIKGLA